MIELRELTVDLGGVRVVDGVSLDVPRGSWVALIGPNGAGKSTVLRAIAGLVRSGGSVLIGGAPIDRGRGRLARLVAYVPQEPLIPDDMGVDEYVLLGRTPQIGYLGRPVAGDRAAVQLAIERLDLVSLATRRLGTLSGGERQRAVLARALVQEAPILLLDEPTSALDVGHQQQALELVSRLSSDLGLTVVAAMHDLTFASQYASEVVLLCDGRVQAAGLPADVLTAEAVALYYGAAVHVLAVGSGVAVVPARPA